MLHCGRRGGTGVHVTAAQDEVQRALPDYVVEREIGRGGMGVVYVGRHARLDRRVAIKELPRSFAADPGVRARFSTEARTLATLAHPHIVPIYDYVERDDECLIVMEELPGGTMWQRFTTTGLTPPVACAIVLACCAALEYAHGRGVLHLDVKPDNLMLSADAAVKVTDFGISRVISGDRTLGTVDGQVLGTPAYMSPEQARGQELTPASDVFSTGVMLYELLSGHLPWTGARSAAELLMQRLREPPRPLHEVAPRIPSALCDVVMKAIRREPRDRYGSAEEFGVAIASACAGAWGATGWIARASRSWDRIG
jgi:serine/threonine-protein kinase